MKIDPKADVPIFQQIVDDIERQILIGELGSGDFIPSVRDLAVALTINPNTVAKAYQYLQQRKLVEPVRGKGLMVNGLKENVVERRRGEMLSIKVKDALMFTRALGFSAKDLITEIRRQDDAGN